jgi:ribose-phosphate pyrophosphokinase
LLSQGAREVIGCASHAVFSPPAVERLSNGDFSEVIVTDTIPIRENFPQLTVLSTANLMAEAIWRTYTESSMIKFM